MSDLEMISQRIARAKRAYPLYRRSGFAPPESLPQQPPLVPPTISPASPQVGAIPGVNNPRLLSLPQQQAASPPQSPYDAQIPQLYGQIGDLRLQQAQGYLPQTEIEAAKAQANMAGAQAAQGVYSAPNPSDLRFHPPTYQPTPYNPQELPTHEQQAIPTRPYVAPDQASSLFAGIAGLLDPGGAGHYATAPLEAAHQYASQAYADALNRYHLATQQADTTYQDRYAQVSQANQATLHNTTRGDQARLLNQQNAVAGDMRLSSEQGQYENRIAPLAQTQAANKDLLPSLQGFAGREQKAAEVAAHVSNIEDQVRLAEADYNLKAAQYNATRSLEAKTASEQAKMALDFLKAQQQNSYRMGQLTLGQQRNQISSAELMDLSRYRIQSLKVQQQRIQMEAMKPSPGANAPMQNAFRQAIAAQSAADKLEAQLTTEFGKLYTSDPESYNAELEKFLAGNARLKAARDGVSTAYANYQAFLSNPPSPNTPGAGNASGSGQKATGAPTNDVPKPTLKYNTTTGKFE